MTVDIPRGKKSGASPAGRGRGRNAQATRAAILQSAVSAFARAGYDGAGVREIAAGAGVDAMLVNRYFGSKEELFVEAVDVSHSGKQILTGQTLADSDLDSLALHLARALIDHTSPDAASLSGFLLGLRSAGNLRAAEILRDSVTRHFERPVEDMLTGADKPARIALLLSIISGVQAMRQIVRIDSFDRASSDRLISLLCEMIGPLLRGS